MAVAVERTDLVETLYCRRPTTHSPCDPVLALRIYYEEHHIRVMSYLL
jgi:hypothetical protein